MKNSFSHQKIIQGVGIFVLLIVPLKSMPLTFENSTIVYGVEIVDGTYPTAHGDVPYRLCHQISGPSEDLSPAVLLAPGYDVHLDRWSVDCVRLAREGYVTFMKGRIGTNYDQWKNEVAGAVRAIRSIEGVDSERVAALASSFGNQEIQSYGLEHPEDFQSYIGISLYNNPQVMRTDLSGFDIPTQLLSGGGEKPPTGRDCDHQAYVWTEDFGTKMQQENPAYYLGWKAFDQETYGCVTHGYMWDFGSPAEKESWEIILQVLDQTIGDGI